MKLARIAFVTLVVWTASLTRTHASPSRAIHESSSSQASVQAPAPTDALDFSRERALLEESDAALKAADHAAARAKAAQAVEMLVARAETERDAAWLDLLDRAGQTATNAQDPRTARAAWQEVLALRERTLSGDDPVLQTARMNLGRACFALGDYATARGLFERTIAVWSRMLPADHADLRQARGNLATALKFLGDLVGARVLEEAVLEASEQALPDDHSDLARARQNLAGTLYMQGELFAARALFEQAVAGFERTLPDTHPLLQRARGNLAITLHDLGRLEEARVLQARVLEVFAATLADDHPDLQIARQSLAITLCALGDLAAGRALIERALAVQERRFPDDHPALQTARQNLAAALHLQGDLAAARALFERVLAARSRTFPDDHPEVQQSRGGLASVLRAQGDVAGALDLYEKTVEAYSRSLAEDHPDLQRARLSLANALMTKGDVAAARAIHEELLETSLRTRPADDPSVQRVRVNLATALQQEGELGRAHALFEEVHSVFVRTLPDEHPDLQFAREALAGAILRLALSLDAADVGVDGLELTASTAEAAKIAATVCAAQVRAARSALLSSSRRAAEERCAKIAESLDFALSLGGGFGAVAPIPELDGACFALIETTRGAALTSAAMMRTAASAPRYGALREALRAESDELARAAQRGTTSEEYQALVARRESIEQEIIALTRDPGSESSVTIVVEPEALAARLDDHEAAVSFRRYKRAHARRVAAQGSSGEAKVEQESVPSLCALVLRKGPTRTERGMSASELTRVELGPLAAIEDAVQEWRRGLGVARGRGVSAADVAAGTELVESGRRLRRLIFDPLLAALTDVDRIVLALDDVLHLVPIDALPCDAPPSDIGETGDSKDALLVGDRWRIETRCALSELCGSPRPRAGTELLVALGAPAFSSSPLAPTASEAEGGGADAQSYVTVAAILRGSAFDSGFSPLAHTGPEAHGIAELHAEVFERRDAALVLEQRKASRESLEELAPKARWLHVATHGWFASESIASWSDADPLDRHTGLTPRLSGEERMKRMSPMLLCGLALAGANLPETASGRVPGLVTADELSTLDLSNCELAVLSACDTNVGERRAGQGVASLQKALQMAGARSVITSLWKVPDEATKELMLDFYRRLWVEKKPKHQALWEAKTKLRETKDERGEPKYTTRDWAAWVLTGNPR